jgi:hypothetical protein
VTAQQLIQARRPEDIGRSLWTTFQRVQENVIRGGQPGRSAQGKRLHTRPVGSIDRDVSLNRGDAQAEGLSGSFMRWIRPRIQHHSGALPA